MSRLQHPSTCIALLGLLLAQPLAAADVGTLVKQCEDCHGKNGASRWDEIPTIAGISAPVHGDFLLAYQDKSRPCRASKYQQGDTTRPETDMCAVAAKLSEADIQALADHFAALPFVASKQPFDAAKATAGKALHARDCAKCHANGGRNPDDDASILGGQHLKYLLQARAHTPRLSHPTLTGAPPPRPPPPPTTTRACSSPPQSRRVVTRE